MGEAVAYARLSDKDSSANSINNQVRRIQEYCNYHKLTLSKTFIDDGKSGWTFDRPAFKDLESYCKLNKEVKYLIVTHFDRFSRTDPVDAMVKERYFKEKLNIKVIQISEPPDLDTSNQTYLMVRFMTAFASNEERNRIVDRVKNGIIYSLMQGRYCSMAPYGYKNSRDENNKPLLVIDEERVSHIKTIFKRFYLGDSQEEIKRLIKPKGFKNSSTSAITRILTNPVYAGLVNVPSFKDKAATVVKGLHQPIITEEVYWQVQTRFAEKYSTIVKRDEVPLRGIIRCECGKLMTAAPSKGKFKYYWYYYCKIHRKNNYSANKLHSLFENIIDTLSINKEDAEIITQGLTAKVNETIGSKTKEIMKLNLSIQKTKDTIAAIEERYLLGGVGEQSFKKLISEKRNLLIDLECRKDALNIDATDYFDKMKTVLNKMQDLKTQWLNFDLATKQKFCLLVFGRNIVYTGESVRTQFLHPMF